MTWFLIRLAPSTHTSGPGPVRYHHRQCLTRRLGDGDSPSRILRVSVSGSTLPALRACCGPRYGPESACLALERAAGPDIARYPFRPFECPSPLHAPGNSTTGPGTLTAPHLGPGYNQTPFANGVSCPSHSCWPSLAELDWTYLFDFKLWLDRALVRVTVTPARPASQPLAPSRTDCGCYPSRGVVAMSETQSLS